MSYFDKYCSNMMDQLHNLGFDLKYVEIFLKEFNEFCEIRYSEETELTKELALDWIYSSNTKSKQQLDRRIRTIKYLGRYLNSIGINAYIPDFRIKSDPPKPVQLLTDDELHLFFNSLDHLPPHYLSPNKEYIAPVIFRLIYSCGLRTSEACNLKIDDVDLDSGILTIYHSKGYKDRIVYLSDSMLELCRRFHDTYSLILPEREYFFQPSYDKTHYLNIDICDWFNSVLKKCNLYDKYPVKPTPHGLRHLFAVKSMKKCMNLGYSFDNWIKYLSQYMGHSSPQETMYYLHMVSHLFPEYSKKIKNLTEGMVVIHEED